MSTSTTTIRQSNMELLRIVAMFLVLLLHATFQSLDLFSPNLLLEHIQSNPFSGFYLITTESVSNICVNLFVLISGYFGIRLKPQTVLYFVFTVLFYALAVFLFVGITGMETFSLSTLLITLLSSFNLLGSNYWFVGAYLVLLFVAPLLNSFIESCSRQRFLFFLLLFFGVQTIFDWVFSSFTNLNTAYFSRGFSWVSFAGLYLLGRYLRLYPLKLTQNIGNRKKNILFLTLGGGYFNTHLLCPSLPFLLL